MQWNSRGKKRDERNGLIIMAGIKDMDGIRRERPGYVGDSTMKVSIRSYEERIPRGTFISFGYDCRYEFQGFDQMLLMMEDMMDSVSVPQPSYEHRSVYGEPYVFQKQEQGTQAARAVYRLEDMPRLPRGVASFVLRFHYRQYGSLQGELIAFSKEGERRVLFRSALELIRLLHEYLDTETGC